VIKFWAETGRGYLAALFRDLSLQDKDDTTTTMMTTTTTTMHECTNRDENYAERYSARHCNDLIYQG